MAKPAMVSACSLTILRDALTRRIAYLENQLAATRRHSSLVVGELTQKVAETAAKAERRRIAEQLRDHARRGSRKTAGSLRMAANLIEENPDA